MSSFSGTAIVKGMSSMRYTLKARFPNNSSLRNSGLTREFSGFQGIQVRGELDISSDVAGLYGLKGSDCLEDFRRTDLDLAA